MANSYSSSDSINKHEVLLKNGVWRNEASVNATIIILEDIASKDRIPSTFGTLSGTVAISKLKDLSSGKVSELPESDFSYRVFLRDKGLLKSNGQPTDMAKDVINSLTENDLSSLKTDPSKTSPLMEPGSVTEVKSFRRAVTKHTEIE